MTTPSVFPLPLQRREKMVLLLHFPEAAAKWLHREDLQGDKGCSLCPEDHDILWEGEEGEKRGLDKSLVFLNKGSFQKLNLAVWKDIRGHQAILTLELSLLMKNFLVLFEHFFAYAYGTDVSVSSWRELCSWVHLMWAFALLCCCWIRVVVMFWKWSNLQSRKRNT